MSFNQQGVTGAIDINFGMSFDNRSNFWETNMQSAWIPNNDQSAVLFQTQQWPHVEQQVWQPTGFINTQMCHDWGQRAVINRSQNVMQQTFPHSASKQFPTKTFAPNPQARTLLPNTTGGFKASIVKRKRKRTMFTTEQIQSMESFYKRKPYITREERQMFVDNLHVSDSAVKVWFQNRRLREKRDRMEREAEALEEANSTTEEVFFYSKNNPSFEVSTPALTLNTSDLSNYFSMASFDTNPVTSSAIEMESTKTIEDFDVNQLLNATYAKMTDGVIVSHKNEDSGFDSDSSRITSDSLANGVIESNIEQSESANSFQTIEETTAIVEPELSSSPNLNEIEAEIEKKTDQFGYVTLDDKAIGDLVNVLDNVLPTNVDLETPTEAEETAEDSDSTTYAGSIYEPISPVVPDFDEEALKARWEPFAPEKSLQKLFELHFC